MANILEVKTIEEAKRVGEFLTSPYTFDQTWAPNEKDFVKQAVLDSLKNENHKYWYIGEEGEIIAALGVRENKYGSGGYEMDEDYVAVHKDHRRKGLATKLLKHMETFVKEKKGRYIHILSCDIESYEPALHFYKNHGYNEVARIPEYYVKGEGRIDLFKRLTK